VNVHPNRTAEATAQRKTIADTAAGRNKDNFGKFLSKGPYGGVTIVEAGQFHCNNDDEGNITPPEAKFDGNFSKGLKHNDKGLVENNVDYENLRDALTAIAADNQFPGNALIERLDQLPGLSMSMRKLTNPLAGVATDVTGLDPFGITIPPAPRLNERRAAVELIEVYWMALLRDVPFDEWPGHPLFEEAVKELNKENGQTDSDPEQFAQHYVPKDACAPDEEYVLTDNIDATTAFRGSAPGNSVGGYISQFLLQDVPFGTIDFEQKQKRLRTLNDYLFRWDDWLAAQNGRDLARNRSELEDERRARHIVTLRDLAHYVRFDALHEAYFNAALILDGLGAQPSPFNPYSGDPKMMKESKHQEGFGTFGSPHLLVAVTEVATRALKAVWHQKWFVHRRLRPEAMAGRVELGRIKPAYKGLVHEAVHNSKAVKGVLKKYCTALLPMAYPEGSPMHPSYGAGHATVAGACVTVVKAFFATNQPLSRVVKVVRSADGSTRLEEVNQFLTVGGELNKLAANIAIGRNAAGVHYRTDYTKSLALGEAVAMAMLQEQAMTLREGRNKLDVAWQFENFSGKTIKIKYDGTIE
jgi:hypothetical protein